ncbi:MAG: response regulator [Piscinibacter sp.]|uniref:response regulator n=1 Tax=Piscinibacter TaxID=1114981 RepID=UPI000FDD3C6C|nr:MULTISPECIES: response regulator [Piscinibacter]MCW5667487.1 response regulator [Piscinibacter sp.]
MSESILVVDDDAEVRQLVSSYLRQNGLRVQAVHDGSEMRRVLEKERCDLVVMDLMLPGEDGITLSRRLRESADPPLPVLMLSGRCDEVDRVIGLEVGADDYMTKPFAPRELLARIRAVLRRSAATASAPRAAAGGGSSGGGAIGRYVAFGDWRLDRIERCLVARDGTVSQMTGAEYSLLSYFVEHPGRVLSRDQLMNRLVGTGRALLDRSIDLRISRLRRLLGETAQSHYIKTIRNEGYVFSRAVEHAPA